MVLKGLRILYGLLRESWNFGKHEHVLLQKRNQEARRLFVHRPLPVHARTHALLPPISNARTRMQGAGSGDSNERRHRQGMHGLCAVHTR